MQNFSFSWKETFGAKKVGFPWQKQIVKKNLLAFLLGQIFCTAFLSSSQLRKFEKKPETGYPKQTNTLAFYQACKPPFNDKVGRILTYVKHQEEQGF